MDVGDGEGSAMGDAALLRSEAEPSEQGRSWRW